MREIVGFVMGAAAGAAGALFVTSTEGKALIERLRDEARPEVERATTEWEPVLNEVARAVRLAARELETATADLRSRLAEIAAALPEESADGARVAPDEDAGLDAAAAIADERSAAAVPPVAPPVEPEAASRGGGEPDPSPHAAPGGDQPSGA